MGRRKTRKVIRREPKRLPKVFRCPRCGEQSVVVDLDRQLSEGTIKCGRCRLTAKLPIHTLTQTIDVYAKFLDLYYEGKIEETPREQTTPSKKPTAAVATHEREVTAPETTTPSNQSQETSQSSAPASSPIQPKPTPRTDTSQGTSSTT